MIFKKEREFLIRAREPPFFMRKRHGAEVFSRAWEREDFWKRAKISRKKRHFLEKRN
jgi:hypothetical protein